MIVEIINDSINPLPRYETLGSSGMDLRADFSKGVNEKFMFDATYNGEFVIISAGGKMLVPTNLFTAIPEGYEVQIRSRSGLALKYGVTVLNSPGTIDSDYRNGWGVILINNSYESFKILQGDRIAQAVLQKVANIEWKIVEKLSTTVRGFGGFGHTGKE